MQADMHSAAQQNRSQKARAVHENSPVLSGSLIDRITRCVDAVHSDNSRCRPNSPYRPELPISEFGIHTQVQHHRILFELDKDIPGCRR